MPLPPPPPYTPDYCNAQYDNGSRVGDVAGILSAWRARAEDARRTTRHRSVAYGDDPVETFDLFEPADDAGAAAPAPLLVFIHGGYWRSLSKAEFSWIAPPFVARGIKVAVVDYGLAPAFPLEEIVRQNLRAIASMWVDADRLGIAPDRIVVSGHSAGGHLTAMMLAARWPTFDARLPRATVRAGVAISGLFDLEPVLHTPYLNVDLRLTPERVAPLSPLYMTPAGDAPLVTAVGADESGEFRRQTREFGVAWSTVLREDVALPGANHFTACERFATPGERLFEATAELCLAA